MLLNSKITFLAPLKILTAVSQPNFINIGTWHNFRMYAEVKKDISRYPVDILTLKWAYNEHKNGQI